MMIYIRIRITIANAPANHLITTPVGLIEAEEMPDILLASLHLSQFGFMKFSNYPFRNTVDVGPVP